MIHQQQERGDGLQPQQQPPPPPPPPPPPQKCPRCDSLNTKFCYFNNYSLSQPRYFCKTCRRYWTHGGTLRNVPVGGGCRKGKRPKKSSSSSSSSSSSLSSSSSITATADNFNHTLLVQQPQDSILVTTAPSIVSSASSSAATVSSSSSYGGVGGGFFSSMMALQSFNHPDLGPATAPFNLPMLGGFNLPQRIPQQQQQSEGFQTGGVVDRPAAAAAAAPPTQEWPPHPITSEGDFWNTTGIGGPHLNTSHWPDPPGYGPSSSSPSFL